VDTQGIYHRAPYSVRVAAASLRGVVLSQRRYDRHTDRQVEEAIDREGWSAEHWQRWSEAHLADLLRVARDRVPAYRDLRIPDGTALAGLGSLPLLSKASLRSDPRSFIRSDEPRRLITEQTSGSTGTPLTLSIGRKDYRSWYALAEARWRGWYGVSRHDRWAIVGGQPVVPPGADEPPYWVWNAGMRQLYLSSYHVSERTAEHYVRAIDDHRVTYLLGYPSSIHALAEVCRAQGIRPHPLRVVVANAEPVLAHQREVISDVFGGPVRETYGMAEYVTAASECSHGRLHLWPEVGVTEVVAHDSDEPVPPGTTGRLVCTGLLNRTMPLIRYVVGDAGTLAVGDGCPCGRSLPVLQAIEGRIDDLVRTPDGRLVGRLDPVFKGSLPISGAQIIQEELDRFRVLVVPVEGYGQAAAALIAERLRERVGDVRVQVEEVQHLPTGANGKFKAVVSRMEE
jgi:phenylacetate-CoA ligase